MATTTRSQANPTHSLKPFQVLSALPKVSITNPVNQKVYYTPEEQTKIHDIPTHRTPSYINDDPTRSIVSLQRGIRNEVERQQVDHELNEVLDLKNIQGDVLVGLHKARMIGLQIKNVEEVRKWLLDVVKPKLTSTVDVMAFRDKFRQMRLEKHTRVAALQSMKEGGIQQTCVNIAFSFNGLKALVGETEANAFSDDHFRNDILGKLDLNDPNPDQWKFGGPGKQLDIFLQIAADFECNVDSMEDALIKPFLLNGILKQIVHEQGFRDPSVKGAEHFGFNDGFGQPEMRGVYMDGNGEKTLFATREIAEGDPRRNHFSAPGLPLVWPGEFLFGHTTPNPEDTKHDEPFIGPDGMPGFSEAFGKAPAWAKDGTFLVFRRLAQDVPKFWNFVKDINNAEFNSTLSDDDIGARFVGRWPSGAPLMRSHFKEDHELGPQRLSNMNFLFLEPSTPTPLADLGGQPDKFKVAPADTAGLICPFAAHIRKMNPRGVVPSAPRLHMILRRGSPYGPVIRDRYTPDNVDRGLLFVCYSSSIAQGFRFQQAFWANRDRIPEPGGHDVLIGQVAPNQQLSFTVHVPSNPSQPDDPKLKEVKRSFKNEWVKFTGGSYLFTPPLSFFSVGSPLVKFTQGR